MADVAVAAAFTVAALSAVAALFGAWRWWTVSPSRAFWALMRSTQAAVVALAALAGVLALSGFAPADGLFWLYALLPLAVSVLGELYRAAAAQSVLDARGLEDAQAVGRLDDAGQRSVVLAILRREMGVMALSAAVIAFLALRAAGTA